MAALRRVIALFVGAAALLTLSACGRAPEVQAPAGFAVYEGRDFPFAFAYPEDWELGSQPGAGPVALGETGAKGIRQGVAVQIDPNFSGDFDFAIDSLKQLATIDHENLQELADERIHVPGAREVRLITSTYLGSGFTGDEEATVPMRQMDLFMLAPDSRTSYYLAVSAPEALWDEGRFRAIVDSFMLKG